jgi:hypothetical protein
MAESRTAVVLIEIHGDQAAHARGFAELAYVKLQDQVAQTGIAARLGVRPAAPGPLSAAAVPVSAWELSVTRPQSQVRSLVTALVPPPPPGVPVSRRIGWHASILFRVARFVLLGAVLEFRRVSGFGPKLRALLRPVWPGLFHVARVPFLYVFSMLYALFAFRVFRYMGTLAATGAIVAVMALLVSAGYGEDAMAAVSRETYQVAVRITGDVNAETLPVYVVYQVLATGVITVFLGVIYALVSGVQRAARAFTGSPTAWEEHSELALVSSATYQAEFEAALLERLRKVQQEFNPERTYVLAQGPAALLAYTALARQDRGPAPSDVTLLTWNGTLSEGATYGLGKVWMLVPRRDWPRFSLQAPASLMWWHLNARLNLMDDLRTGFPGPDFERLAEFKQPMIDVPPGLAVTNKGTVADVLAQVTLQLSPG